MSRSLLRFSLAVLALVAGGSATAQIVDVAAGAKRAQSCFACHGKDGVSAVPGTPHLAGQDRRYLEAALKAYRGGTRQDPTMNAMAKPLSDADIANIAAYFHVAKGVPSTQSLADVLATQQRIAPIAAVAVGSGTGDQPRPASEVASTATTDPKAKAPRSGQAIYAATCSACHGTGAAGAPKFGDGQAWRARIAQGRPTLVKHTMEGINAMPARGMCMDCSDKEIDAVVGNLMEHAMQ